MKTYFVEYTVEVSRIVTVKAEDKEEAAQLVREGQYLSIDEETESDSSIDIVSIDEEE